MKVAVNSVDQICLVDRLLAVYYTHSMLIYKGVTAQDLDTLVVWPNHHGHVIATRGYDMAEAVEITYRTLVDDGMLQNNSNPELDATLTVTKALDIAINLIRIGFAPTPEMIVEISTSFISEKHRAI